MPGLPFRRVVASIILLGILMEINMSYKLAIGRTNIAMPAVPVMEIPRQFRDTITEVPMVRAYDGMTMSSGTVMWMD